jgi:hypothetical protein
MKKILLFILSLIPLSIMAQNEGKITMDISQDTVGLNGSMEVIITVENAKVKKFEPPSFDGFEVQGPSTASSMSIINGDVTQKVSYTFYLTPTRVGELKIDTAMAHTEGGNLRTDAKSVIAVEHYESVSKSQKRQRGFFDDDFESPFLKQMPVPKKEETKKKKYTPERI